MSHKFGVGVGVTAAVLALGLTVPAQAAAAPAAPPAEVTAPTPAPGSAAPVEVNVQAWNMYQLPNILNVVSGSQADSDARVQESVKQLADSGADVLLLSEVNGTAGKAILDGLREQGYIYQTTRLGESCAGVYGACSNAPWSVNGGVAVVSKLPITESEQYVYTSYAPLAPDMFANKGAVMARIDKDGQEFWVVAMHTQADDTINDRASGTHAIRMKQAEELRRFVDTFAADGAPVIYGGDFNTEYFGGNNRKDAQGLTEFQQLVKRSGINLFDPAGLPYTYDSVTNKLVAAQGYKGYRDTLDYFGTTGSVALKDGTTITVPTAGNNTASDHEALRGTFVITRGGDVVRVGGDPSALNPSSLERVVYFVRNGIEAAIRVVVITIGDATVSLRQSVADLVAPFTGASTLTARTDDGDPASAQARTALTTRESRGEAPAQEIVALGQEDTVPAAPVEDQTVPNEAVQEDAVEQPVVPQAPVGTEPAAEPAETPTAPSAPAPSTSETVTPEVPVGDAVTDAPATDSTAAPEATARETVTEGTAS